MAFWKETGGKTARRAERRKRKRKEDDNKATVRRRDRTCRFPLCGCRPFGYALHVSHQQHKGMGGNPEGDRSTPDRMIYVCVMRHKESRFAIDKGTIRWRALTDRGSNGPVAWDADYRALRDAGIAPLLGTGEWLELARERDVQVLEPPDPQQRQTLRALAKMEL